MFRHDLLFTLNLEGHRALCPSAQEAKEDQGLPEAWSSPQRLSRLQERGSIKLCPDGADYPRGGCGYAISPELWARELRSPFYRVLPTDVGGGRKDPRDSAHSSRGLDPVTDKAAS